MSDSGKSRQRETIGALPTVVECRSLKGRIRQALEALEEETNRAYERGVSSTAKNAEERSLFARASTTSLLSIAAGLLEIAAEREQKTFDDAAFEQSARDCAEYVKQRREKR